MMPRQLGSGGMWYEKRLRFHRFISVPRCGSVMFVIATIQENIGVTMRHKFLL
jgi:hypothetical protein